MKKNERVNLNEMLKTQLSNEVQNQSEGENHMIIYNVQSPIELHNTLKPSTEPSKCY